MFSPYNTYQQYFAAFQHMWWVCVHSHLL